MAIPALYPSLQMQNVMVGLHTAGELFANRIQRTQTLLFVSVHLFLAKQELLLGLSSPNVPSNLEMNVHTFTMEGQDRESCMMLSTMQEKRWANRWKHALEKDLIMVW